MGPLDSVGLPEDVRKIYAPLLEELAESGCSLNQAEFSHASNLLFEQLSVAERDRLIAFYRSGASRVKRSSPSESHSFSVPQLRSHLE